jgi:hypothetical protein
MGPGTADRSPSPRRRTNSGSEASSIASRARARQTRVNLARPRERPRIPTRNPRCRVVPNVTRHACRVQRRALHRGHPPRPSAGARELVNARPPTGKSRQPRSLNAQEVSSRADRPHPPRRRRHAEPPARVPLTWIERGRRQGHRQAQAGVERPLAQRPCRAGPATLRTCRSTSRNSRGPRTRARGSQGTRVGERHHSADLPRGAGADWGPCARAPLRGADFGV